MLVTLNEILLMAERGGYCVPAFNVYNMETVMGAVAAAEELRAPVILQVYPRLVKEDAGYYLAPIILAAAKAAHVPVCFHLDHGPSELETTRAIRYGATGVMLDASKLPLDENIEMTKRVVDTAAYVGIGVEGELGYIGSTKANDGDEFTSPEDAARFVRKTGVACLAVAVGTAHGRYTKPPKLDIERIVEIRRETGNTPLVLHGGSGVPDSEIVKAVKAGIRKMNFATDICYAFLDSCLDELSRPERAIAIDNFMKKPIEAVKNFCISKIKLLGAEGRA